VSDAWRPQINGVVTTLENTLAALHRLGHRAELISAEGLHSIRCPSYPEIRLALCPSRAVRRRLQQFAPAAIHIATEGPLGLAARGYCLSHGVPFTSSYHTQFPEYVQQRSRLPAAVGYAYLRWFHRPAARTLVGTATVRANLQARGFTHLVPWSRGVDSALFRPDPAAYREASAQWPRPILLYAGRVAVEKNLEAFLSVSSPGTKLIVGDGPALPDLRRRFPEAIFLGYRFGAQLARQLAGADVFVFPSHTDTFGIVMLEAMACGLPVAAFPVQGPLDVVRPGTTGVLHADLALAIRGALQIESDPCRSLAQLHTWERCTRQFIGHLVVHAERPAAARARTAGQQRGSAVVADQ